MKAPTPVLFISEVLAVMSNQSRLFQWNPVVVRARLNKERPPQGRPLDQIKRSTVKLLMVDDHGLVVAVDVAVMIVIATVLDHDGVVAITMIFLADDATVAIPIAIVARADGHADRANAYAHFFRASRHGETNSGNGDRYYCKTLDHGMLLQVMNFTFVNYRLGNSR
jgi:hypothetical protein